MEEDKFPLVEKIIKDLHNVLSKIAELYEFDVVPMDNNVQNKSPVLHLENCLGLESWCVKHVYMYCYSELIEKYCTKIKGNLKKSSLNSERLVKLLNVTLLLNPETNILWNKRREMVSQQLLDKTVELHFTRLVLSRKPKCNEAFGYRRWLLERILEDESLQVHNIESLVNDEFIVCDFASDKSPNNYHSWNHRIWLLNRLKTINSNFDLDTLFIKEFQFISKWCTKHVSDFSCFHYYQFCLKNLYDLGYSSWEKFESTLNINMRKLLVRVLAEDFPRDNIQASDEYLASCSEENLMKILLVCTNRNCNCPVDFVQLCKKIELLFHALVSNNELLKFYKHHETLWYHRRFIIHEIIEVMCSHYGLVRQSSTLIKITCKTCKCDDLRQKQAKIVRYDRYRIFSSILFNTLMTHEKKTIEARRQDDDKYADRHENYLKYGESLNNFM